MNDSAPVNLTLANASIELDKRIFGDKPYGIDPRGFVAIGMDGLHVYIHEPRRAWLASGQHIVEEFEGFPVKWRFGIGPVGEAFDKPKVV